MIAPKFCRNHLWGCTFSVTGFYFDIIPSNTTFILSDSSMLSLWDSHDYVKLQWTSPNGAVSSPGSDKFGTILGTADQGKKNVVYYDFVEGVFGIEYKRLLINWAVVEEHYMLYSATSFMLHRRILVELFNQAWVFELLSPG